MKRLAFLPVLLTLGGCTASTPRDVIQDWDLEGKNEEHFLIEYDNCLAKAHEQGVDYNPLVGLQTPRDRAVGCMYGKGYRMIPAYERQNKG